MSKERNSEWLEALQKTPLTSRLRRKEPLKRFNTWRIGGNAECLVDVVNVADLSLLLPFIATAPPIVPGIPIKNSMPPHPRVTQR
jgi:hypothetical protein